MGRSARAWLTLTLYVAAAVVSAPVSAAAIAEDCFGLDPTISGSVANDLLTGTPDADVISAADGDDVVLGNGGNDVLCGGDGNDLISGGKGIDFAVGGPGADMVRGDAGSDWLFDVDPTVDVDPLFGILPRAADESVDRLIGGPGSDLLAGEGGDDVLDGGEGADFVHGLTTPVPMFIDLSAGIAWSSRGGLDSIANIENAIGSGHPDVIVGDDGNNSIGGLSSSDRLYGAEGADVLYTTVEGSEILGGGDPGDLLWVVSPGPVRIDLPLGTVRTLEPGAGADAIGGFTDVLGTQFDDVVIGDESDNKLFGVAGSDRLSGGAGNDAIFADGPDYLRLRSEDGKGGGRDFLDGGSGDDFLDGGPKKDGCINGEKKRSCESDSAPAESACAEPDPNCTWPLSLKDPSEVLTMVWNASTGPLQDEDMDWIVSMVTRFATL